MYKVCPNCGIPSFKVIADAVLFNLNNTIQTPEKQNNWQICMNTKCDISYFSDKVHYTIKDLKHALFFKDESPNTFICYCSQITRGEIKEAVNQGCKNVKQVRDLLNKNNKCECKTKHPLGKCCCSSFDFEIKKELKNKPLIFKYNPQQ